MQSHTKLTNLFVLVCLISFASAGFARESNVSPRKALSATEAEGELSFPYIAEITEDNVNIRSGPGTNYYHCGKLNTGKRIKVVARKYSWSHIVPPAGSFSWISKQYVKIDLNNPNIGVVTGNAVRVYAGSDFLKPIHSTTVQLELDKGDKVWLLGEEMDDYYKITPPTGAYLWVLSQYTKPIGAVDEAELTVEPKTKPEAKTTKVVPVNTSIESEKLKEYYALAEQIDAEKAKPIAQQNYTEIKKALAEIASKKEAGKAAQYSEFALKQIGRCELAVAADQAVKYQDSQLQHIEEQIENTRTAELEKISKLGEFAAIGQFQPSTIYGQEESLKHYRIIDDSGQTICYALPEGSALQMDLSKFEGRKVGLVGTVEPHLQTKGALVRFTKITELE